VDARQRWQALQSNLKSSRLHFDQGNYTAALEDVDRALAIDPDFLAAQSLRDRIVSVAPGLSLMQPPSGPDVGTLPAPFVTRADAGEPIPEAASAVVPDVTAAAGIVATTSVPADDVVCDSPFLAERTVADIAVDDASLARDADALKPASSREPVTPVDLPLVAPAAAAPAVRPVVSQEGYAQFERRARRRRADRRLDAARSALAQGRLKDAASALDEVIALDPNLPELRDLTARYEHLRRNRARPHAGRWLAAAAAFGAIVLGASWLQDATGLWSRQTIAVAPLIVPPEPFGVTVSASETAADPLAPVATSGGAVARNVGEAAARAATDVRPATPTDVRPATPTDVRPAASTEIERRADVRPADQPRPFETSSVASPVQTPAVVRALPEPSAPVNASASMPVPPPAPAAAPVAAPVAATAAVRTPDDESLIKQVLQRYRSAYEGLDARSARAVWPAVNETALARAFDGLASQSLTFDGCDVTLRGDAAAAARCHGSARYIPKVGSREPRVEPRTWDFTLRKDGTDWKIQSARAGK
jgi:tetratricopeptide (TPR) repeat protein